MQGNLDDYPGEIEAGGYAAAGKEGGKQNRGKASLGSTKVPAQHETITAFVAVHTTIKALHHHYHHPKQAMKAFHSLGPFLSYQTNALNQKYRCSNGP